MKRSAPLSETQHPAHVIFESQFLLSFSLADDFTKGCVCTRRPSREERSASFSKIFKLSIVGHLSHSRSLSARSPSNLTCTLSYMPHAYSYSHPHIQSMLQISISRPRASAHADERYLLISSLEEWICLLPSITVSPILSRAHTGTTELQERSPRDLVSWSPLLWRRFTPIDSLTLPFYRGEIRETTSNGSPSHSSVLSRNRYSGVKCSEAFCTVVFVKYYKWVNCVRCEFFVDAVARERSVRHGLLGARNEPAQAVASLSLRVQERLNQGKAGLWFERETAHVIVTLGSVASWFSCELTMRTLPERKEKSNRQCWKCIKVFVKYLSGGVCCNCFFYVVKLIFS